MRASEEPLPDNIMFKLSASEEAKFPLIAYTASEKFQTKSCMGS